MILKGNVLGTLSPSGEVRIVDSERGELIESLGTPDPPVTKLLPTSDGSRLLGITRSGRIHQWALPTPKRAWGPEQALGKPDSPAGDRSTAWASLTQDEQNEWLILEYAVPVEAVAIHVYENHCPGALIRATTFGSDHRNELLWEGQDPVVAENGQGVAVLKIEPKQPIRRIKLYLDSKSIPGWNEIDAVGLEDTTGAMHWATAAAASSTYAQRLTGNVQLAAERSIVEVPVIRYEIPENAEPLSHVDDSAEAKQSLGGSGHAVRFSTDGNDGRLCAVEIYGSRYGRARASGEFSLVVLDADMNPLSTMQFPYGVFDRGDEEWRTLSFAPLDVPEQFYVAVDFNPTRTKGIYVGKDTDVDESHSFIGTAAKGFEAVDDSFDWMIRAHLQPAEE